MSSVRDSLGTTLYSACTPYVIDNPLVITGLTPSLMSPQLINTTISWTATANGGAGGISGYEFEYTTDGGTAAVLIPGCEYSASNTCEWIPSTADSNYQIRVKVSDNAGGTPNETIGAWSAVYPIDLPATIDSLTPDKASPQVGGTTITWTASASGGAGGIAEYRFEYTMDGGVTAELIPGCDYPGGNTCEWRPTLANSNYQLRVLVLDNAGGIPVHPTNETVGAWSAPYAITEAVAINSLTPDKASPQIPGTTITWTASANGGAGGISGYEFEYTTDGGTTPVLIPGCEYSASNTCEWVPAVADPNYQVRVKVRDNAGGTPNETIGYWSNPYNIVPPVQIIEFIPYPVSPQVINTTIQWAVDATYGAGTKEYAFTYKRTGVSETTLCDYSTDNTCEWVPSVESDSYQARAYVRDQAGNITPTAWTVYPIDPPATIDSLTPNPASPQVAGTTVTWTASASGGAGGIGAYRFESTMDGGVTVDLIPGCDYNGNTCEWSSTLASPNYQVRVNVLDNAGGIQNETVGAWSAPYAITEAVAINSLTPDKAAPQVTGTTITWTASANGGAGGISGYEFEYTTDGGATPVLIPGCGYSASNTCDWVPAVADPNYQVRVKVKDNAGGTPNETIGGWSNSYNIELPVQIVEFISYPVSPQVINTTIQLTVSSTGGVGAVQYRFTYSKDGGPENEIAGCEYSATNTCDWVSGVSGTYLLTAYAQDSLSNLDSGTIVDYVIINPEPLMFGSLTHNGVNPLVIEPSDPSQTITFTATATGGSGYYDYRFLVRGPETGNVWVRVQDYSSNNTWDWTVDASDQGLTSVYVYIKDKYTAEIVSGLYDFTVLIYYGPLTFGSLTHNSMNPLVVKPSDPPQAITFTATATGGSGQYDYRFLLRGPETGNVWLRVQDYSSDKTWDWTVDASDNGLTSVYVYIKDRNTSEVVGGLYDFTVTDPIVFSGISANLATPLFVASTDSPRIITFTATATKGSGQYDYRFLVRGPETGNVWLRVQDYSSDNTWDWTVDASDQGLTSVYVYIKDRYTGVVSGIYDFTVFVTYGPLAFGSLTHNSVSPLFTGISDPAQTITFTATATGGTGTYDYRFLVRGPETGNVWLRVQDYSSDNTKRSGIDIRVCVYQG